MLTHTTQTLPAQNINLHFVKLYVCIIQLIVQNKLKTDTTHLFGTEAKVEFSDSVQEWYMEIRVLGENHQWSASKPSNFLTLGFDPVNFPLRCDVCTLDHSTTKIPV